MSTRTTEAQLFKITKKFKNSTKDTGMCHVPLQILSGQPVKNIQIDPRITEI